MFPFVFIWLLENVQNLAAHELITLLLLIYFRKETTLEEMAELVDLEDLQVEQIRFVITGMWQHRFTAKAPIRTAPVSFF
jgi:hypothetical protein